MRIMPINLHKNNLIEQYRNNDEAVMKYFNYAAFSSLEDRYEHIMEQSYAREDLVEVLMQSNKAWHASSETFIQINRLLDDKSVVVVGGQQAGLLTGPAYTLNKIISIIMYAKQQEEKLNIPVIPLFWIAGEDHDYDEINHTYIMEKSRLRKLKNEQILYKKQSLSHMEMNKDDVSDWLYQIFQTLKETTHTKSAFEMIMSCMEESETYVDFFAHLVHQLFNNTGIVLIDSGDKRVRQLESSMFQQLLSHQEQLAKAVVDTKVALENDGFAIDIEVEQEDAHLFYHDEGNERILLKKESDQWIGKNNEVTLTTKQLEEVIEQHPERISNNVISRPLMQEYLFPTLAFLAGDGEIAYWATLKEAFSLMEMEMPPVIPRLSMTYITSEMENLLEKRDMTGEDVVLQGTAVMKEQWLQNQDEDSIDVIVDTALENIKIAQEPMIMWGKQFSADMEGLAKTNIKKLNEEVEFMRKRMKGALEEKYALELQQFDALDMFLHPNNGLQERVWNPLLFLNHAGKTWIHTVIEASISFENNHYLVYLD